MSEPLLLHSLSEFRTLLLRCFEAAGARSFVEIGSETGEFTRELLAFAHERDGRVTTVEPLPAETVVQLDRDDPAFRLVRGQSPEALAGVEAADAWLIDGDHNYWCVRRELEIALDLGAAADRPPLVVLHDVGWPCARRDFYYDPSALPADAVHPHSFTEGIVPGNAGVVAVGGLRGAGQFAVARHEGGPRNGILTAIEDVLAEREGLSLHVVPAIYGLGVVVPDAAPWAAGVRALLEPFAGLDLLDALERNRLRLYLEVLRLQDEPARLDARRNRLLAGLDERIAELEVENAALRLELARAAQPA